MNFKNNKKNRNKFFGMNDLINGKFKKGNSNADKASNKASNPSQTSSAVSSKASKQSSKASSNAEQVNSNHKSVKPRTRHHSRRTSPKKLADKSKNLQVNCATSLYNMSRIHSLKNIFQFHSANDVIDKLLEIGLPKLVKNSSDKKLMKASEKLYLMMREPKVDKLYHKFHTSKSAKGLK